MQTIKTSALINDLQQQTEEFLQKAISEWQMLPPSKLLLQPGENNWSAAQCLAHLNSYGYYYLPAIEKAINMAKTHSLQANEYKPGWLGDYFTKLMMPPTKGKKMKKMSSPKNHYPSADVDSDSVIQEFINQQEKMLSLLEEARSINIEKSKVAISIAKFIKLQLGDVFRFLIAHTYRHVLQAERALTGSEKETTALESKEKYTVSQL